MAIPANIEAEIRAAALKHGLDPAYFRAVIIQESGGNPNIHDSSAGAKGIAQLVPRYHPGVDPYDPVAALDEGARFLSENLSKAEKLQVPNPATWAARAYNGGADTTAHTWSTAENQTYAGGVAGHYSQPPAASQQPGAAPATPTVQAQPTAAAPRTGTAPPVRLANAGVSDATPGPLPANWADVPTAPISNQYMPPSQFTASSPAEQARWAQASTPAGYAALAAAARAPQPGGAAPGPAVPAGGGPPASPAPSSPLFAELAKQAAVGTQPPAPTAPPPARGPQMGGALGWAGDQGSQGTPSGPAPPQAQAVRNYSDEELARIGPDEVAKLLLNGNMTDADRMAFQPYLAALSGGGGT